MILGVAIMYVSRFEFVRMNYGTYIICVSRLKNSMDIQMLW